MIFSSTSDSNKEEVVVQKSKRGRKPNSLNKKTLVQNKINMIVTTESTTNSNSNQNDIDNNANQLPNTETETKPPLKKEVENRRVVK